MPLESNWLLEGIKYLIPLLLSLTVHEWAHAFAASRLGDDTAERMGRLTLNPIPHIDPLGTVILPLLNIPFGWARPVPVNPVRFTRKLSMSAGMMIVAVAGPLSNVVLALLCAVGFGLMARFGWHHEAAAHFLGIALQLNVALAVFNMLPIPPLDGSRIADGLMPLRYRAAWESFAKYGPLVLLMLIVMPRYLHVSVLAWPMMQITDLAIRLIDVIRGV
jgi:Zn-dependent protease